MGQKGCEIGVFPMGSVHGASLVAPTVKNLSVIQKTQVQSWVGKTPWRKAWQPTPVFLPGEFHGWRSLAGYSPWGRKESDTTERPPVRGTFQCWTCEPVFVFMTILCRGVLPSRKLVLSWGWFALPPGDSWRFWRRLQLRAGVGHPGI